MTSEVFESYYLKNFPFSTPRPQQVKVLKEIESAFTSGYSTIVLELPTGGGKSAIGVSVGLTLGSSYILVSTKDLQHQYASDFPWLRIAKGKNNFLREIKDDFIRNNTFVCKPCGGLSRTCSHTSVEYGPCMSDKEFDCKYKTSLADYRVINKGGKDERITLDEEEHYRDAYSDWSHLENLKMGAL